MPRMLRRKTQEAKAASSPSAQSAPGGGTGSGSAGGGAAGDAAAGVPGLRLPTQSESPRIPAREVTNLPAVPGGSIDKLLQDIKAKAQQERQQLEDEHQKTKDEVEELQEKLQQVQRHALGSLATHPRQAAEALNKLLDQRTEAHAG